MGREHDGYRDNLASILEFTQGGHTLNCAQVSRYTGIKNFYAIKKRYQFTDGRITAEALARALCGAK